MHFPSEGFHGEAPALRVRAANGKPVDPARKFVLYWMIAARRPASNVGLDRAVAWAVELGRPLVVLEALGLNYPYASERLHRFVLDGMADNMRAFEPSRVLYYAYVERRTGEGRGLLARLSRDAAVIVTDDYPCISLPHLVARAAAQVDVRLEAVDSNGLIPLAAAPQAYPSAAHFRRFVQRTLRSQLSAVPSTDPLADLPPRLDALPADVLERWPSADPQLLQGNASVLATLPIDHEVPPVTIRGGFEAAKRALRGFVRDRLASYGETQRHPDARGTSRLSPYLHFGHLSAHEVFDAVMRHERWNLGRLSGKSTGARDGWWGVGAGAEAFLDQVVVWRELALNTCAKRPDDYASFEGLPSWAQATLEAHSDDPRPFSYDLRTFERAETHDPVWNAAQREMLRDGWMHNYMRMLWGKKILEWSPTPRVALETMTALMNRWALDGRDPNSYAGYMWTLGRYDRPWPERPIYGTVRSMSSDSAVRKVRLKAYLARNGGERSLFEV